MFIVSKFHDYYDSVMRQGMDKTCVYKRETVAVPYNIKGGWKSSDVMDELHTSRGYDKRNGWTTNKYVIGFCGELYPLVHIEKYDTRTYKNEEHFFYTEKEYNEFFGIKKVQKHWYRKPMSYFFDPVNWKKCKKYFVDYKCPVFILKKTNGYGSRADIILNPPLKDYKFVTQKDPYTTFQEIYMFMSGVIGSTGPHLVEISDKIRAQKHGFDKWSFRKPPKKT